MKDIRHWWIEKPVSNNMASSVVFEEFRPTIIHGPNREWIKVISIDDLHKSVGMSLTHWIESQKQIQSLMEENNKLRFMINEGLGWQDMHNDI